jgi:hypothetical protein
VWEQEEMVDGCIEDLGFWGQACLALEGPDQLQMESEMLTAVMMLRSYLPTEDVLKKVSWNEDQMEYLDQVHIRQLQSIIVAMSNNSRAVKMFFCIVLFSFFPCFLHFIVFYRIPFQESSDKISILSHYFVGEGR